MHGRVQSESLAAIPGIRTKLGDFETSLKNSDDRKEKQSEEDADETGSAGKKIKGLRTEFHYNIQVVLPSNATEDVYLNIFNAIRKTFQ